MANDYYRKSAVLEAGGFNEEMHVMEDRDILWRIEKAGYKVTYKDIAFCHHRSVDRFTLRFILNNAFTYGYYWNKLFSIHPDKVGITAMPIKLGAFVAFSLFSFLYLPVLWILLGVTLFWFSYHFYRDKRVRNCLQHMETTGEKIGTILFGFSLHVLFDVSHELGKLYAILT